MLDITNLSIKTKDLRDLIEDFNFVLNENDKVAVIGEEGNGKSTLLKAIYDIKLINDYCNITGHINKKDINIDYLEQILNPMWYDSYVYEYLLKNDIEDIIDDEKYNDLSLIIPLLSNLKLDSKIIESNQKIGTLSGGERVKIQLVKILFKHPDVILLDEPTNDLDIETLEWLENFINNSQVPIIFISHDETLLERTANIIIHMEQIKDKHASRYTIAKMGYRDYVNQRLHLIDKQGQIAKKERALYKAQMDKWRQIYQKVEYQQETISRSNPHGGQLLKKKIKSLKAMERRIENKELTEIPDVEENIYFDFDSNITIPNSKVILDFKLDKLKINEKLLSSNLKLKVVGPEHIVIIGKNGVGKTTLFKNIYDFMKDRTDIKLGYMPQNYEDLLPLDKEALSFLLDKGDKEEITKSRTYMGSMKFTRDEMISPIRDLSGGQKAKLLILKMILSNCNVLLLDEPTRNLSPLSTPIIRDVLSRYKGTIISISHDRKYISEVCSKIYELKEEGLIIS